MENIDQIINKRIPAPISREHNTNYNKRFKSGDKRRHSNPSTRLARFEAYQIYRTMSLNDDSHINYMSFVKIIKYICQEILYQIYYKRRSWFITGVGKIVFTSIDLTKAILPNGMVYNGKINRSFARYKANKTTSLFMRRFRFQISDKIKSGFCIDYKKYNTIFTHKRENILTTV